LDKVIYFVVGDANLNSGNGIYVKNLEEMKQALMKKRLEGEWRLVISIHGAEDVIATQGGFLKDRSAAGAYEAADLKKLFVDDEDFKKWREAYGPTWTTLNACQVHKPFETVILQSFNKSKATQKAQGLGQGCRPQTETKQYYAAGSNKPLTSRSQLKKLSKSDQKDLTHTLAELNKKFGYFGSPPVAESQLLHYYFDEEPKGGWPVVTVSYNRVDTGISFYDRTQNARFLGDKCSRHMGPMRGHTSTAPPVAD
jgi:hypothetical protein